MTRYKAIRFNQFGSSGDADELYLFAAPAQALVAWAGIPRKGWRVRMLYQRWVTPGRDREVRRFWDNAGDYFNERRRYLLGPTALTLAATAPLDVSEDGILLRYERPFSTSDSEYLQLSLAAEKALATIRPRLDDDEASRLETYGSDVSYQPTEYEPNHVLTSAIQIAQLSHDSEAFCEINDILPDERSELLEALEALCRPALVVDGQHRLLGAAQSTHNVTLPVVLIPNASWLEQIYQFVVINETAKRVPNDLLTDIFGNSLSPSEQDQVRSWLSTSHVQVEARIAAVVAGSNPESPFHDMVALKLGESQISKGFITETTIRQLIDGGRGGTSGWRNDPDFYETVVRPTIPAIDDWDSWTSGRWREYWFAFWSEVSEFYNSETTVGPLWSTQGQTNLTKSVTLRVFQELFMSVSVEYARTTRTAAESLRDVLAGRVGDEELEEIVSAEISKGALPDDIEVFRRRVREDFLAKGVPVRVFERPWVKSLDDTTGISELRQELRKAYELSSRGERYRAQNKAIFSVED